MILLDGNNFYASCEQVFRPALRGRPLVVLSNNDGCAIARSAEAKALGIKMGQPAHDLREYARQFGLVFASANFALYGDMSARILRILRDAAPRVQPYSIDESFASVAGIRDEIAFAHELRARVTKWTGIPNCIGIAGTHTLAKLANKVAKRGAGVVEVKPDSSELDTFPIADVWGVGPRWAAKLESAGITTAAALRDAPADWILTSGGVTLARTQRELQGHACLALEEVEPDRKQIVVSRSFGQRVDDHAAVLEAMATFMVRAAEKMRARGLAAGGVWVFANTDTFRPELRQHHPSRAMNLAAPTTDTRTLLHAVRRLATNFLRAGCAYRRAGVALLDLARPERMQQDLFTQRDDREALMPVLDAINRRFGRATAGFAASGWKASPAWKMRQADVSPHYTTKWKDLPRAIC